MRAARRAVLRMMAGAAGALLLPFGAAAAAGATGATGATGAALAERRAVAALSRLFSDPAAVRAVGAACRGCTRRPTVRALAADLGATVGDLAALDRAALRRRLDRRIRADFGAGRVISVDGWVLARTETRLYTLLAAAG